MKNVMIFGDSYSTFEGNIPEGYVTYYPSLDVQAVEDTWWKIFVAKTNVNLVLNNSWSGSTVCYTGWEGIDCSKTSSFIYRYRQLKKEGFFEKNAIDTIIIFGATNDSWSDAPLGEGGKDAYEEKDLYNVFPAIEHFASSLKADLPNVSVVFIINTGIKSEVQDAIERAAAKYGLNSIRLAEVDKEEGHPTKQGMLQIAEQLAEDLKNL